MRRRAWQLQLAAGTGFLVNAVMWAWQGEWLLAGVWLVAAAAGLLAAAGLRRTARRQPPEEPLPSALLLEKRVQTLESQRVRLVGDVQTPSMPVQVSREEAGSEPLRFTRVGGRDVCGRMPSEGAPWVREHCDREPGHPGRHSWEPCAEVDPSGEWMCAFSGGHEGRHSWVDGR